MTPAAATASPVPAAEPVTLKRSARKGSAQAHAAKKYVLLKNKTLKAGTTLEVRITRSGYIGTYFGWKIISTGTKPKITRCMKPGSTTPRTKCT